MSAIQQMVEITREHIRPCTEDFVTNVPALLFHGLCIASNATKFGMPLLYRFTTKFHRSLFSVLDAHILEPEILPPQDQPNDICVVGRVQVTERTCLSNAKTMLGATGWYSLAGCAVNKRAAEVEARARSTAEAVKPN